MGHTAKSLYIGIPHFTEPIFMIAHVLPRIANESAHAKGSDTGVQMLKKKFNRSVQVNATKYGMRLDMFLLI